MPSQYIIVKKYAKSAKVVLQGLWWERNMYSYKAKKAM